MGAGILPITLVKNSIFILLGQERYDNKWSDFGGSHHPKERIFDTAIREGMEELNGILGTKEKLKKKVENNLILRVSNDNDAYTSYVFNLTYDENLVEYFDNINKFAEQNLNNIILKNNGLYEKKAIKWYNINDFKNPKKLKMLRPHYQCIIKTLSSKENQQFLRTELS